MTQTRDNEDVINSGWQPHNEELWLNVDSTDFNEVPESKFLWVYNLASQRVLGAVCKKEVPRDFLLSKGFTFFQVAKRLKEEQNLQEVQENNVLPKGIKQKTVYIVSDDMEFNTIEAAIEYQKVLDVKAKYSGMSFDQLLELVVHLDLEGKL